eukprot:6203409-Pleurochrysis_carterae.AAC.5
MYEVTAKVALPLGTCGLCGNKVNNSFHTASYTSLTCNHRRRARLLHKGGSSVDRARLLHKGGSLVDDDKTTSGTTEM